MGLPKAMQFLEHSEGSWELLGAVYDKSCSAGFKEALNTFPNLPRLRGARSAQKPSPSSQDASSISKLLTRSESGFPSLCHLWPCAFLLHTLKSI